MELNVYQFAQSQFGGDFSGGPERFDRSGWIDTGPSIVSCYECKSILWGFRLPYFSSGRTYHYWALVCPLCRSAIEPSKLNEADRKELYKSSDLPPGNGTPEPSEQALPVSKESLVVDSPSGSRLARSGPIKRHLVIRGKEFVATLKGKTWQVVDSRGMTIPTSMMTLALKVLGMPKDAEGAAILRKLDSLGVEYLCHFTRFQNIPSILERGILSRSQLQYEGIDFLGSDNCRADGRPEMSSLSISKPNLSMLQSKITDRGRLSDWVVLLIDKMVLSERGVLFFPWNAASNNYHGRPNADFQGYPAFLDSLPSSGDDFEQQEVMVPFPITPVRIIEAVFPFCPESTDYGFREYLEKRGERFELRFPNSRPLPIRVERHSFFPTCYT